MKQTIVQHTDTTFLIIIGISFFFLAVITALMFYFMFKYSRKKNPVATDITGNTTIEILWTVIPTILVMVMFFYGYAGFKQIRNAPADAMTVKVTGRMWVWNFEYENGVKSDTLFVPTGKPVKLELNSVDVNHSFYIPAFRIKEDAVPGRKNYLWFEPTEDGEYFVECAEYCGLSHSYMLSKVVSMPKDKYDAWYNSPRPKEGADTTKPKTDSIKTK
jgi:cytochrome c oxidase subunit II